MLLSETLVNKKYKGLTSGLMGNFDGSGSNDFILPNGTLLDANATKTERDIFYNFGQHCKFILMTTIYIKHLESGTLPFISALFEIS